MLWQQPGYRVGQLLEWLYARRAASWDEMTNLPKTLRERLRETYPLPGPNWRGNRARSDTTQKFLWRLADGALIESVLIPASPGLYGEPSDRHTFASPPRSAAPTAANFAPAAWTAGNAIWRSRKSSTRSWPSNGAKASRTPGGCAGGQ